MCAVQKFIIIFIRDVHKALVSRSMSNLGSFVRRFSLQFLCVSARGGRDLVGGSESGVLHELP